MKKKTSRIIYFQFVQNEHSSHYQLVHQIGEGAISLRCGQTCNSFVPFLCLECGGGTYNYYFCLDTAVDYCVIEQEERDESTKKSTFAEKFTYKALA